jgi:hypothetical protein
LTLQRIIVLVNSISFSPCTDTSIRHRDRPANDGLPCQHGSTSLAIPAFLSARSHMTDGSTAY